VRLKRPVWITSIALYLVSQIFFLINIQFPKGHNFDEFHYVPSAKQFLALTKNQNWEHPPLGKLLMAVGIAIFGDRPIGWRFMSTVFGSLTLVGMYFLALAIFESSSIALWVALLTLFNQLLYVQARIGMLDTFMFAFIVWSMAAFCATWNPKRNLKQLRILFAVSGALMGLATACKWFAVVPWFAYCLLILIVRILQSWGTTFAQPKNEDWYRPQLWKGIRAQEWFLYFGVIPLFTYFITFIPYLFVPGAITKWSDFITMQFTAYDGQLRVVTNHPYMSRWLDWAIPKRPIWYAFERGDVDKSSVRGVILLGNPAVMWFGLVAILLCFKEWFYAKRRDAFLIFYFYFCFYACWIAVPRKIEFYYYYYPAGMMLSLAAGFVLHQPKFTKPLKLQGIQWAFLCITFALFVYFFPILAALKIPSEAFRNWMWLPSWI
jgi:dolichyl-phosphate-mannose--protein O-mannosyl transferase